GLPIEAAVRLPGYVALLLWVVWLGRLQKELFPTWPKWLLPLTGAAMPAVIYNFFTAQSDSLLILGTLIALTRYIRIRTAPPPPPPARRCAGSPGRCGWAWRSPPPPRARWASR